MRHTREIVAVRQIDRGEIGVRKRGGDGLAEGQACFRFEAVDARAVDIEVVAADLIALVAGGRRRAETGEEIDLIVWRTPFRNMRRSSNSGRTITARICSWDERWLSPEIPLPRCPFL